MGWQGCCRNVCLCNPTASTKERQTRTQSLPVGRGKPRQGRWDRLDSGSQTPWQRRARRLCDAGGDAVVCWGMGHGAPCDGKKFGSGGRAGHSQLMYHGVKWVEA